MVEEGHYAKSEIYGCRRSRNHRLRPGGWSRHGPQVKAGVTGWGGRERRGSPDDARASGRGYRSRQQPRRRCEWPADLANGRVHRVRSEEHTSELQSLMRISYAVFCLNKKKYTLTTRQIATTIS